MQLEGSYNKLGQGFSNYIWFQDAFTFLKNIKDLKEFIWHQYLLCGKLKLRNTVFINSPNNKLTY